MQCRTGFKPLLCALLIAPFLIALSTNAFAQSGALAVVNDRTIALNELDPQVQQLVGNLDNDIAAMRRAVLQDQINELLFEAEAKKRGISVERLLDLEVERRIVAPTAEEIQSIYEANRAQFGAADFNTARARIIDYLRQQSAQKHAADFVSRLVKRHAVVLGTDVNSAKLGPETVLATVAGRALKAGPILERLKPLIYDLRMRAFEATKNAVEQMIYSQLVLEHARRQGVGPEVIIRNEITNKLKSPTEEEIARFYEENKSRIHTDLEAARPLIINYLEQQQQLKLERALSDKLRAGINVRIMLTEPEAPVLAVSADDDPSRGDISAPVTVVIFTDFQCPSCAANHPLIEEAIKPYGKSVRLVVRDFPLEMHEHARKAAEAANAAHAQGKFFEYAELLFKNQKALDVASLKKYASQLGLNRARFDAALDSGQYAAEVEHDVADGEQYGVRATPSVYVNGVLVRNLSDETLREAIDRALARKKAGGQSVPANSAK